MKILITNHHLYYYTGTENYVFDIAIFFKKMGHEVFVFSPILGGIAKDLEKRGVRVSDNIKNIKNIKFDIIHAHHNIIATYVRFFFPNTPMIFMSHGVMPLLEQPPSIDINIVLYCAVSEEVQNHLVEEYGIKRKKISIIRNFVDVDRFYSKTNINETLKKILVISNHYMEDVKNVIEPVCRKKNISLVHVGLPENPVEDVENYINDADLVITLGKGVLETLACRRNVIVYDEYGADGFMTKDLYYESRKNNFSGRRFRIIFNQKKFENALEAYNSENVDELFKIIFHEHSINNVCKLLLDCYGKAIINHKKLSHQEVLHMKRVIKSEKKINFWRLRILHSKIYFWKVKILFLKIKFLDKYFS